MREEVADPVDDRDDRERVMTLIRLFKGSDCEKYKEGEKIRKS